jgi:error-prone DNA polymerase
VFPSYAELHCLTNFSFLRGASHPEELVERAAQLRYNALAITDECSVAGVVRAHIAAKELNLKLIVGAEFGFRAPGEEQRAHASRFTPHASRALRCVLLATDRQGYGNLCELITRGRRQAKKGEYSLTLHDIEQGLPGCLAVWLPPLQLDPAHTYWLSERFRGAAWIAAELLCGPDDRTRLVELQELSRQSGLPLVAAGDVHMHVRKRRALQDTLTAIRLKCTVAQAGHALFPNGERHLRRLERLARLYPPELLIETLNVAERCNFSLDTLRYEYPEELVPAGETPASHLRKLTEAGFQWRFGQQLSEDRGQKSEVIPREPRNTDHETRSAPGEADPSPFTLHSSPSNADSSLFTLHSSPSNADSSLVASAATLNLSEDKLASAATSCSAPDRRSQRVVTLHSSRDVGGNAANIAKARALVEHELALIADLHYEPYFLTVYDIVRFARDERILCQGRGSAANSAVCYCLGITEVDPARMEMLFERFISKERNEPPDIDVDFEHERREEVIQYIYRKYGRERAAIAATVISYRPKSAVRDVGKALGLDLAQVDRLAKNLAWWDARQVREQRLREVGFDPNSRVIQRLLALVNIIVGFPRHLSQHVGGFVISRGPLSRLVPIENAAMPERTVIEWDKDDLDALGLLKIDVLGLGMLTAIRRALDLVAGYRKRPFTMADVPPEDAGVYEMVGRADTIGVFQIESRAQQAMLPRMRPQCFYDLVIEVAIVRPGPIQGGMIHPYLRRRQGLEPVTYPSEDVRQVLERTLGVPIFQEQVMQLAVVAAGFTPGEADRLRRAMAAWRRRGGLEPFEQRLKDGMRERGYSGEFADQIYRQILGFGEYGFPESHSASFALLVYVSCWLKRYEPAAFTCALLNSQPMGFYSPAQLVQDAQRHAIEIRPVDVLYSEWDCALEVRREVEGVRREAQGVRREAQGVRREALAADQPAIRLGLRMVKGLSEETGRRLALIRNQMLKDQYSSVDHASRGTADDASRFAPCASRGEADTSRLTPHASRGEAVSSRFAALAHAAQLNRHDMNVLAAAGALATITGHRRQAVWEVTGVEQRPPVLDNAPIFDIAPTLQAPTEGEDLVADYASLGLTLGRHPVALLRRRLDAMRMVTAAQLRQMPHGRLTRAAGLVIGRQRPDTASGVIFVTLEDETGMINVVVWNRVAESQRRALLGSKLLAVHGVIEREGEVVHLVAGKLVDHSNLLGRLTTRSRDFH